MDISEKNLNEALETVGLSKRETSVYLLLLKQGASSPSDIALGTGMPRPNVYDVTKSLEKKGLLHHSLINKRRLVVAESPTKIIESAQEKLTIAKELAPLLSAWGPKNDFKRKITFYEGKKSMQNLFMDGLTCKSKIILYLWSPKDMDKILGKTTIEDFIAKRLRKGIRIKSLRPAEKESPYRIESDKDRGKSMTSIGYIPEKFTFSLSTAIYDDKVAFYSSKRESFGFLVESKEFAEVVKMLYDTLWQNSGKLNN